MKPITIEINDQGGFRVDWQQWILNEIENRVFTQTDIAATYAILIEKGYEDFGEINQAILGRWRPSGLQRIKDLAWKAEGMNRGEMDIQKIEDASASDC